MSEEIEAGKEIVKATQQVAGEIYKDVAKPSLQPIGQILSFFPRTIRLCLSGWEKWLINGEESLRLTAESLKDKVNKIPEEKLVEPESYVAIPAMQQLSYCQDSQELREMYANLLASSMNADKKWNVHPAFVDIIKQLNPDEAKILKTLAPTSSIYYPLIDLKLKVNKGFINIYRNFAIQGIEKIEHQGLINSYIDNLCRLDLIEIPPTMYLSDESKYQMLERHPIVTAIKKQNNISDNDYSFEHKCFNLTDFGVNFIETCCFDV